MIAAYQKQKETVEYLLVKGADPTLRSRGCGQGAAGPFASLVPRTILFSCDFCGECF